MIFLDVDKDERRKTHLSPDHVFAVTSPHTVCEKQGEGLATLECRFRASALRFKLDGEFPGLRTRKCADGLLLLDPWGETPRAHVIELKRTVRFDTWSEIKEQFLGALLRAAALGSLCDIQIGAASCYVAYRDERLTRDPILARRPEHIDALREWHGERPLQLPGLRPERIELKRVRLDADSGTGSVELDPEPPPPLDRA